MGHEMLIKSTVASSLAWNDNHEQAVDRVVAVAIASKHNELGALMLRVEAFDAQSMRKVIALVVRQINRRYRITRGFSERIAQSALQECLHPHCTVCVGRGELHHNGEVVMVCIHCGGSGLKRYSDKDRREMVGSTFDKFAYEGALGYMRDALRMIVVSSNQRLTD